MKIFREQKFPGLQIVGVEEKTFFSFLTSSLIFTVVLLTYLLYFYFRGCPTQLAIQKDFHPANDEFIGRAGEVEDITFQEESNTKNETLWKKTKRFFKREAAVDEPKVVNQEDQTEQFGVSDVFISNVQENENNEKSLWRKTKNFFTINPKVVDQNENLASRSTWSKLLKDYFKGELISDEKKEETVAAVIDTIDKDQETKSLPGQKEETSRIYSIPGLKLLFTSIGESNEGSKESSGEKRLLNWLQRYLGNSFLCFFSFSLNLTFLLTAYLIYFH